MSSEAQMYCVRAEAIASSAEAEGRKLRPQEQAEAQQLLQQARDETGLEAKIQQMGQALSGPVGGNSAGGSTKRSCRPGIDRQRSPSVVVPFAAATFNAAATFDGDYGTACG